MKGYAKTILAFGLVLGCFSSCKSDVAEPVKYDMPQVNFTMPSDLINAVVGEPVSFSAEVVSGDKVSIAWYVDGKIESSSQSFVYEFTREGTHKVRFEARNGAGTVEHEYTVNVSDKLSIRLSVGDSTRVFRMQHSPINVAAVVQSGADVEHKWYVDGELACETAFFGSLLLAEARDYEVEYQGVNAAGSYSRSFVVEATERPLQVSYSVTDPAVSLLSGSFFEVKVSVLFGGKGLTQTWTLDSEVVSTEKDLNLYLPSAGVFTLEYNAVNGKGETASRSWTLNVTASGTLMDTFEGISELGGWWTLGQNQPGIELFENPLKEGINTSDYVMRDKVNGEGGTSGYFDLTLTKWAAANPDVDLSKFHKIRVKCYLNGNDYYPMVQINGATQIPPVVPASKKDAWVILEYDFGKSFDASTKFTFRAMRNATGGSISGYEETSNNRTVFFDDFEFVE